VYLSVSDLDLAPRRVDEEFPDPDDLIDPGVTAVEGRDHPPTQLIQVERLGQDVVHHERRIAPHQRLEIEPIVDQQKDGNVEEIGLRPAP
jgi:hypothetical protein